MSSFLDNSIERVNPPDLFTHLTMAPYNDFFNWAQLVMASRFSVYISSKLRKISANDLSLGFAGCARFLKTPHANRQKQARYGGMSNCSNRSKYESQDSLAWSNPLVLPALLGLDRTSLSPICGIFRIRKCKTRGSIHKSRLM